MTTTLIIGLLIPLLGTMLGSAFVFFMKGEMSVRLQKTLLGFASGVMVAASVWSLLIPAMAMEEGKGAWSVLPAWENEHLERYDVHSPAAYPDIGRGWDILLHPLLRYAVTCYFERKRQPLSNRCDTVATPLSHPRSLWSHETAFVVSSGRTEAVIRKSIINCQFSIINCQLSIINCQLENS